MGNVIDIRSKLKSNSETANQEYSVSSEIVDLTPLRLEKMKEDRRNVKRTILTEFITVHAVVPGQGLLRVSLYDINEDGLSFDLEESRGRYNIGDAIELRIYMNHQTYFKIESKIAHITILSEEGIVRHGCEFIKEAMNTEALTYFIKFLESVTASLRRDGGDILVSKINS